MTAAEMPVKQETQLRPAEPRDVDQIASLGSRVFSATFGHSVSAEDLQDYLNSAYSPAAIRANLANPQVDIFVACSPTGGVVGFVQLTQGTSEPCVATAEAPIELQRVYVEPEYHGNGVGKMLATHAEHLARQKGFRTLWLGVWEENVKAQGLYRRLGFEKVGTHDFKTGQCVQTDWIMAKSL